MKLKLTKERILMAALKSKEASQVLKALFPEVLGQDDIRSGWTIEPVYGDGILWLKFKNIMVLSISKRGLSLGLIPDYIDFFEKDEKGQIKIF